MKMKYVSCFQILITYYQLMIAYFLFHNNLLTISTSCWHYHFVTSRDSINNMEGGTFAFPTWVFNFNINFVEYHGSIKLPLVVYMVVHLYSLYTILYFEMVWGKEESGYDVISLRWWGKEGVWLWRHIFVWCSFTPLPAINSKLSDFYLKFDLLHSKVQKSWWWYWQYCTTGHSEWGRMWRSEERGRL